MVGGCCGCVGVGGVGSDVREGEGREVVVRSGRMSWRDEEEEEEEADGGVVKVIGEEGVGQKI